jgi:hypothetical protein
VAEVVLEEDEKVESIDGLRGIIEEGSARVLEGGFEKEAILGEEGGERFPEVEAAWPSTGAETLRCTLGWLFLRASSLNASLVTALRRSSPTGLACTLFAGLGARRRSAGTELGAATGPAAAAVGEDESEVLCVAREYCDKGEV